MKCWKSRHNRTVFHMIFHSIANNNTALTLSLNMGDPKQSRGTAQPANLKSFPLKTVGQDRMQIQFKLHKGKLDLSS
ncbi:MAG: hypothetical protein ACRC62_08320 [Microcoleus sp.]